MNTIGNSEVSSVQNAEIERDDAETPPKASPRATARVRKGEAAQSAQSGSKSAATESNQEPTLRDVILDWVTPPEIWTEGSRPLKDEWDYAKNGGWTADVGTIRKLGQVYSALVVFPVFAVAEYVKWIVKRPSRLVVAVVLSVLLAQFPPLSWII